jgi:hypothetical protein
MKKYLFLALITVSILCVSGCGSGFAEGAAIGTGVAVGGNAYLNAVKAGLDEKEALLIAQREAALNELSASTDDLEKAALQNKIKVMEKQLIDIGGQKQIVDIGNKATETNWADPEAVGGLAGTGIAAFMAWYFARKGKTTSKKYDAIKAGVNKTLAEQPKETTEVLYKNIGEARKQAGVS